MPKAPRLKVYSANGEYLASCKYYEHAGALVGLEGDGANVRIGHSKRNIFFTQGKDGDAGASYDIVAEKANLKILEGVK